MLTLAFGFFGFFGAFGLPLQIIARGVSVGSGRTALWGAEHPRGRCGASVRCPWRRTAW